MWKSFNLNDLLLIPKLLAPRELNFLKLKYSFKIKSNFYMALSKKRAKVFDCGK